MYCLLSKNDRQRGRYFLEDVLQRLGVRGMIVFAARCLGDLLHLLLVRSIAKGNGMDRDVLVFGDVTCIRKRLVRTKQRKWSRFLGSCLRDYWLALLVNSLNARWLSLDIPPSLRW